MRSSTKGLLIGVAAGALAFGAVALAANSASFLDETKDAGGAPDISRVSISNDDAGKVTIRVEVADRRAFGTRDEVTVLVDADQNPDTGAVFYGAEFALDLIGTRPAFLVPQASGYMDEVARLPASFTASFADGAATFSFSTAELAIAPGSRFGVLAASFGPEGIDLAPEMRTVSYPLVAGTPTVELGPDRRAPLAEAFRSTGVHGRVAKLWFTAADGRGETADTVRVYRGSRLLKTISTRLADTSPFYQYHVTWRVPKKVRGKLRFCVFSLDRAGNKSNVSCAPLTIR